MQTLVFIKYLTRFETRKDVFDPLILEKNRIQLHFLHNPILKNIFSSRDSGQN